MSQDAKKYREISKEACKQLEKDYYTAIVDNFRRGKVKGKVYKYEVIIQDIKFVTYMTGEELKLSVGLVIDLLEELKEINNSGIDRKAYEQLVAKIDRVRRVGGAWALLIENPGLINAICAVCERLMDQFENEELYEAARYFLLRAIMKMHGDEVKVFE